MTLDPDRQFTDRSEWAPAIGLVLLALLTMGNVLPNGFVRDDIGILLGNDLLRGWHGIYQAFGASYWPPVNSGELYRPLTIAWMTVQWQLGGGHALLYRLVSLGLYAGSALAVWRLLRRVAPPTAAWMGAALFAVHPVHVEALVEAVSQSELIVAILLCAAVAWHIDANAGRRDVRATGIRVSLCFAFAIFFKENALILPALLLASDRLVDSERETFAERWRRWRPHYEMMIVIAAVFWVTRGVVLGGGTGTQTQEALTGGLVARTWTMLGVPAEWLRLFLWPAHLQDEWSLQEWIPTHGWSLREVAGLIALGSVALAGIIAWRRRPHLAFGILWAGIALAPVANILIPTGVIIAERTLFLPSVGVVIVAASLLAPLTLRSGRSSPVWRWAGPAVFAGVLALGMVRSALRLVDWRSPVIWAVRSIEIAPLSWRTHLTYATYLAVAGDTATARIEARRALALRPGDPLPPKAIADDGRKAPGGCASVVPIYQELVRAYPRRSDARASLLACLAYLGRYQEAKETAAAGVREGLNADFYALVERRAEQAIRGKTPAGAWRIHFGNGVATDVGGARRPR